MTQKQSISQPTMADDMGGRQLHSSAERLQKHRGSDKSLVYSTYVM